MDREKLVCQAGFTILEVIVAGVILIVICVGTAQTFVFAARLNRGNNLRMQALSVLQKEVEYFRSLKFVPGLETTADLNNHRSVDIRAGNHTRPNRTSADLRVFAITVQVTNFPNPSNDSSEEQVEYKEITITAVPVVTENEGWLQNLHTQVTVQRVRSN